MKTRVVITSLIALAALAAIFGYKVFTIRQAIAAHAAMQVPPVTVSAAAVVEETWPNTLSAIGSLSSHRGITVKSELEGLVRSVVAESGAVVAEGDALVTLDTASEEAQLSGLEAEARLAELNFNRAHDLRARGTNTQSDLDAAEATAAQTRAAVAQLKVTIAKKHIVAPFAGRLGIVKVFPGQFLNKGDALVVLESIDPIYADFSLPQQEIAHVSVGQTVRLAIDAYPGRTFESKITAISPRVADATRSVDLRATLENKDESLRPGMFARAEIVLPSTDRALVVPSAAVVYNPYGETVYVIENGVAQQRFIQTGVTRGDLTLVRSGLKIGDRIVTSGQVKLRNGAAVQINNAAAPDANPAPKPTES
jgi:membrane fusion protein (multidrug efflux system)